MRRATLALLSLCTVLALPVAGCAAEPSKTPADAAFGKKVRAYLMAHPEVIQEAMNRLQEVQSEQLAKAAATAIDDNRKALERDTRDPVSGPATAQLTMTEFFDYRCPYCKTAAPAIPAFLARHRNVRLVYKEFPILAEMSEAAARMALAAKIQGKYEPVHQALMVLPSLTEAGIDTVLTANGVDLPRAHKDAEGPAIKAQIADVKKLAQTLGVGGTPAFIVGDKVSNGWAPDELDAFIASAAKVPAKIVSVGG